MPCGTGLDFGIIQKEYSACGGEHCSPAERSGSRKVPGSMTNSDPYSVGADSLSARTFSAAAHDRVRTMFAPTN